MRLLGTHAVVTPAQRGLVVDRAKTRASIARELLTDAPAVVPLQVNRRTALGSMPAEGGGRPARVADADAYHDGKSCSRRR